MIINDIKKFSPYTSWATTETNELEILIILGLRICKLKLD